jgi:hypothetical protein
MEAGGFARVFKAELRSFSYDNNREDEPQWIALREPKIQQSDDQTDVWHVGLASYRIWIC